MAVEARGDLFGKQGSISIDRCFQPASVAVQAVSTRRFCGRKIVEQRFTLVHYNLREGLSSSLERERPQLPRNEKETLVASYRRASSSVARKSFSESHIQGFLCGKELPIDFACGTGGLKGRLQSHVSTRHSEGTTIVQGINRLPNGKNEEKNTVPTVSATEFKRYTLHVGRGAGNIHMPSASTMTEEIAVLKNSQQQGIIIDSYRFVEVLKRCLKYKDLIAARQVHDCIIQSGMTKNPYVANTLLNVYITCGRLHDARRVFDGLEKKTDGTWSIMIAGYVMNHHAENALEVFNRMRQGGAQPGERTCLNILKACASPLALKCGEEVHGYIRHAGLESDVRVGTALVQMYAKCSHITEARRVFENLGTNRNVITWNVMIGAYAESGCGVEAYRLFLRMKREGFIPNAITYVSVLNASASAGALEWVKEVHRHALKAGLESDLRVGNALIHMFAKSGSIGDARLIFDRLKIRDLVTWNMMIGAYAETGVEAYRLFLQMQRERFIPDAITYVSILKACAIAVSPKWGKDVHVDMLALNQMCV